MHIETSRRYGRCYIIFIKHNNDIHVPAAFQNLCMYVAIECLVFELSKLRFRAPNLFDRPLKGANKMHNG